MSVLIGFILGSSVAAFVVTVFCIFLVAAFGLGAVRILSKTHQI